MALQDVIVSIELSKPSGLVGLGKPLIITQKTGASTIKNYSDIEGVKPDFAATTEAYKKAAAILGQENRPASISIATYDPADTTVKSAVDSVGKYFDNDWFFVLTAGVELEDEIAVADYVEGKKVKFYAVKVTDVADLNAFKVKNYEYVFAFYHPTDQLEAAAVGELGSREVGSVSWKFKKLAGITPIDMTADELATIHEAGGNTYVTKAGTPQTSEGLTSSGEYIDTIHGKSWLKVNIENSVQQAFTNNGKVSYDSSGIALLTAAVTTVFVRGFKQGIIAKDDDGNPIYTVNAIPRGDTPAEDRAARVYKGLSFSGELAGAIHSAQIKGEITG